MFFPPAPTPKGQGCYRQSRISSKQPDFSGRMPECGAGEARAEPLSKNSGGRDSCRAKHQVAEERIVSNDATRNSLLKKGTPSQLLGFPLSPLRFFPTPLHTSTHGVHTRLSRPLSSSTFLTTSAGCPPTRPFCRSREYARGRCDRSVKRNTARFLLSSTRTHRGRTRNLLRSSSTSCFSAVQSSPHRILPPLSTPVPS